MSGEPHRDRPFGAASSGSSQTWPLMTALRLQPPRPLCWQPRHQAPELAALFATRCGREPAARVAGLIEEEVFGDVSESHKRVPLRLCQGGTDKEGGRSHRQGRPNCRLGAHCKAFHGVWSQPAMCRDTFSSCSIRCSAIDLMMSMSLERRRKSVTSSGSTTGSEKA